MTEAHTTGDTSHAAESGGAISVRVLLATNDAGTSLAETMRAWGYEVAVLLDASELGPRDAGVRVGLLDWTARRLAMDGPRRQIQAMCAVGLAPIILLPPGTDHLLADALDAGASDYIMAPVAEMDLRARLQLAAHRAHEGRRSADGASSRSSAAARLRNPLPICSYCKSVRDEHDHWHDIEDYLAERAGVQWSHGVCPGCLAVAHAAMHAGLEK